MIHNRFQNKNTNHVTKCLITIGWFYKYQAFCYSSTRSRVSCLSFFSNKENPGLTLTGRYQESEISSSIMEKCEYKFHSIQTCNSRCCICTDSSTLTKSIFCFDTENISRCGRQTSDRICETIFHFFLVFFTFRMRRIV